MAAALAAVALSGCSACPGTTAAQTRPTVSLPPVQIETGVVHVHGLGVDPGDGALYAATHSGLFRLPEQGQAERIANRSQDTMGFSVVGPGRFIGSGHPDPLEDRVRPPLLGLIVSTLTGGGNSWYKDPEERKLYSKASWIWVGLFCFRLSIQLPLYLSGLVGPLAVARVVTGLPLFALGLWLSYLLLRPVIGPLGEQRTSTS